MPDATTRRVTQPAVTLLLRRTDKHSSTCYANVLVIETSLEGTAMRQASCTRVVIGLGALTALSFVALAQNAHSAETTSEVPALREFHTVIFEIWHKAWPNKDYDRLKTLLPEIEKGAKEVAQAKLPGILREKQSAWDANIEGLMKIVADYRVAVQDGHQQGLLDAAEKLHSQYEKLVRTIRPVLKEVDSFHATLYVLYHYHLPQYDLAKIQTSAAELKSKLEPLHAALLPPRLKEKEQAFTAARQALSSAVDDLVAALPSREERQIKAAIEAVHTKYQALEGVFGN